MLVSESFIRSVVEMWMRWMMAMSWQVSLVVAVVFTLSLLARKASPRFRYALWCLVLIKLCLPPTLSLVTGIGRWLPAARPETVKIFVKKDAGSEMSATIPAASLPSDDLLATSPSLELQPASTEVASSATPPPGRRTKIHFSGPNILFSAWLAGMLFFVVALGFQYKKMRGDLLRASAVKDAEALGLIDEAKASLGVKASVRFLESPNLFSPILLGLLRPHIIIPAGTLKRREHRQILPIFLHELAHFKRRDLWANWVQVILQILYWFHPLVWLANLSIRKEREMIVDDMVLVHLKGEREAYGRSLVSILKRAARKRLLAPGYVGIVETSKSLRLRLRRILDANRKLSLRLGWMSVALVIALALILIPQARVIKAAPEPGEMAEAEEVEKAQETVSDTEARVVEIPWLPSDVTQERFHFPRWGPKGNIAVLKDESVFSEGQQKIERRLILTSYSGGVLNQSPPIFIKGYTWSADGKYFYALISPETSRKPLKLFRVDAEELKVQEELVDFSEALNIWGLSTSPDGRNLAYVRVDLQETAAPERYKYELCLFDIDSRKSKVLKELEAIKDGPGRQFGSTAWIDQSELAFTENRFLAKEEEKGVNTIWDSLCSINIATGEEREIVKARAFAEEDLTLASGVAGLCYARPRKMFVFVTHPSGWSSRDQRDLNPFRYWAYDIKANKPVEIRPSPGLGSREYFTDIDISPDAKLLTFASAAGLRILEFEVRPGQFFAEPATEKRERSVAPEAEQVEKGPQWLVLDSPVAGTKYALQFDGLTDFVEVPDSPSLDLTNSLTLEAWVNFDLGGDNNPRIISKGWEVRTGYELAVYGTGEKRRLAFLAKGLGRTFSNTVLHAHTWYHVAATYDGTEAALYINGRQDISRNVTGSDVPLHIPTNNISLNIGRNSQTFNDRYKGLIKEVRVWSVARSEDEIRRDMNRVLTGGEPHLSAYWKLDEGEGVICHDTSPNHNDGRFGISQKPRRPWGPEQATGAPDTDRAGDIRTAWASLTPDSQDEWLLLVYGEPVVPVGVNIYETYNPGAVNKVSVFTQDGKEVEVWTGKDPTPTGNGKGVSEISFNVAFKTDRVKIYLDSPSVSGWNEIDAVALIDAAGKTHWATRATASSTYADYGGPATTYQPTLREMTPKSAPGEATSAGDQQIPKNAVRITHVDETAEGERSLGASGHAVLFELTEKVRFVEAVQIFASRYGYPQAPQEDFHLYLLNDQFQVLADLRYPYGMIERGELRWYTLRTPSIEVPRRFYVALSFNPHQTKGIYLGFDESVKESHSLVGLPDSGFEKVKESYDWMVRVYLSEHPSGIKGIQRLADWKPPEVLDPFKGCIEAKYDMGKSDGMQSYGGSGPAIQIRLSDFIPEGVSLRDVKLKGLRLYASRYGTGYDPEKTFGKLLLLDTRGKVLGEAAFPYALFSYKEKWVDVVLPEPLGLGVLAEDGELLRVAFDPGATRYKGIYFHYTRNPKTSHSLVGTAARGFQETPDREWLIRAYFVAEPVP